MATFLRPALRPDPTRPDPPRERTCQLCDATEDLTRHHLIPRLTQRQRGKRVHAAANIAILCRPCHNIIEGFGFGRAGRDAGESVAARARLRARLTRWQLDLIVSVMGHDWLDHRYPPAYRTHDDRARGPKRGLALAS